MLPTDPLRHGLLLLPGCALSVLGLMLDALAAANEAQNSVRHEPLLLSLDGQPVAPGCGPALRAAQSILLPPASAGTFDAVWLLGSARLPQAEHDGTLAPVLPWLRHHAAQGAMVGAFGTAAALLAQAGLLDGHRATLPWAHVAQMNEAHPAVVWSSNLYEIDRRCLTCAGGASTLDAVIAWLMQAQGQQAGDKLAAQLIAQFGLERLRAGDERQATPLAARIGGGSAKLGEAVALMEANLGEPLPTDEIARLVGISRRQMERLFKQHLDELPSRYYAELRLARARQLLQQTSQSILQIGLSCGFASGSHFSNAYRARFGHTPRDERSQRAQAWRSQSAAPVSATPSPHGSEPSA
jgi:transcriptional regulator GlxA family with amidase domain